MCGRLYQTIPLGRLLKIAKTNSSPNSHEYTTSHNVCPTTFIPAIKPSKLYLDQHKKDGTQDIELEEQQNRQVEFMKWGHKSPFNFIVNGRIQELLNKKTFLNFIENRCVVIMQGYYEWNEKKEPFSFKPIGADHFLVAALYTAQKEIVILTKDATPELSTVHHRMPVLLSHEEVNLWMNPKNTKIINDVIQKSLLRKDKQVWKNVGCAKLAPYVSSVKQKSNKCLMTIEEYKKELDKNGLMRFWKKAPAVQTVNKDGEVITVGKVSSSPNIDKGDQKNQKRQIKEFSGKKQEIQQAGQHSSVEVMRKE